MDKKICVIGAGPWGMNHIRTLKKLGSLAGIVDIDSNILELLSKEYTEVSFYDNVDLPSIPCYLFLKVFFRLIWIYRDISLLLLYI